MRVALGEYSTPEDSLDLSDTFELLLSDPARYHPAFPYEREIRLHQFVTWIYFSKDSMFMVRVAGMLTAARYLGKLEKKLLGSDRRAQSAKELKLLLNDTSYRKLFDATIGKYGGWSAVVETLLRCNYHDQLAEHRQSSESVVQMIDYRFRYLDHGGADRRQANISHSEFYCWKEQRERRKEQQQEQRKTLSWKTIRKRWSLHKKSAHFLYVNDRFALISSLGSFGYESRLTQTAADRSRIRQFLGYSAYVARVLQGTDDSDEEAKSEFYIPENVKPLRLPTKPLTEADLQITGKYKEESGEMRKS
jgi:hypothetical protein